MRKIARNPKRVIDAMWKTRQTEAEGGQNVSSQEIVGSVDVDPDDLEIREQARRGAQGTRGLSKNNCRENVSLLSGLKRGLRNI